MTEIVQAEIDELLAEIGTAVIRFEENKQWRKKLEGGAKPPAPPPAPIPRRRAIEVAREYLSGHFNDLHAALCTRSEGMQKVLAADETLATTALADLVAPFCIGFPPFVLACLVMKIGIKRLCAGNPFSDSTSGHAVSTPKRSESKKAD